MAELSARVAQRSEHHPLSSGYEAETIVLTRRGLLKIADVETGDVVLTDTMAWRHVVATRQASARTVRITGGGAAIECTPDRMLVAASTLRPYQERRKYQPLEGAACLHCKAPIGLSESGWPKTSAKLYCNRSCNQAASRERAKLQIGERKPSTPGDIDGLWIATPMITGDMQPFAISRNLSDPNGPRPSTHIHDTKRRGLNFDVGMAWMVGRWVGDGWTAKGAEVVICTGKADGDNLERELLSRFPVPVEDRTKNGLRWHRRERATADNFYSSSVEVASFLRANFGSNANNKTVPLWLLQMDVGIRRAFLEGYLSADGHKLKSHATRYTAGTVSPYLAIGLRLLFASFGMHPSSTRSESPATTTIEGRVVNQLARWTIGASADPMHARESRELDGSIWARARESKPGRHDITVYDLDVSTDGTFTANGIFVYDGARTLALSMDLAV